MTAREKRVLRRALKGFVAALLGQTALMLQGGVQFTWANVWAVLLVPGLVAFLLALEKALQPEIPEKGIEKATGK